MKKINHYVLNGAIALLSTTGFVACSSSDEVADAPVNPTYDGKSVKTQFAISIATPQGNGTRMTETNTQNGNSVKFLGMDNIKLIPLTLESGNPDVNSNFNQIISLSKIDANSTAGAGITGSSSTTPDYHKVYNDVNIATGTNNFLFYGTSPLDTQNKFKVGSILSEFPTINNAAVNPSADGIKFALDVISTSTFTTNSGKFASYLNGVADAKWTDSQGSDPEVAWSSIRSTTNRSLNEAYKTFTKADVLRAGSANAVLATMQELYNVVKPLLPTDEDNPSTDVEKVALAIKTAITGSSNGVQFTIDSNGKLSYSGTTYSSFPTDLDLPEGAAQYSWTSSSSSFAYVTGPTVGNTTDPNKNAIAVKNIAYPLPLTYFVNTPVKALDAEFTTWKTTASEWEKDASWDNSWKDAVSATTRTVALRNNINYGVACLNTKVICATKLLLDNSENPIQVTVPNDGLEVTGVLVGGQPKEVNWQFVDETTATPSRDYVVFDNEVDIKAKKADDFNSATSNYTLVFDNYCTTSDNQKKVNVAIELKNNTTQEFVGVNGKVAPGQTFYLVGTLDATNNTTASWPTTLPPSYTDRYPVKGASSGNINRVFVQDFTTTANFKITSLKNAYVTIPDLRAANLQLGLSVDLTWKTGLKFEVEL